MLALTIGFTSQTHVHAEDEHVASTTETASIVPYGRVCVCGGTYYLAGYDPGVWGNDHEEKCIHHNWGNDMIQTRTSTKTYKCNSCGRTYQLRPKETRRVCKGYDS